jgi:hypothetical protein
VPEKSREENRPGKDKTILVYNCTEALGKKVKKRRAFVL